MNRSCGLADLLVRRRRWFSATVLVGYLALSVGFPLPSLGPKDLSSPFPCQDHACGCRTADDCRQQCCCFTRQQKLAWADRHGVDPATVVGNLAAADEPLAAPRDCCRTASRQPADCRQADHACADGSGAATTTSSCCRMATAHKPPGGWVLGISTRQCRGLVDYWFSLFVMPVALPQSVQPDDAVAGPLCMFVLGYSQLRAQPPVPPPEAGCPVGMTLGA